MANDDGTGVRVAEPYGTWPSPVTPELLVERAVGLAQVQHDGATVWWNEARPAEAGRQVLVAFEGGEAIDRLPPPFSARTQVHEYGGRCFAVGGETVVFSNWEDQRLWLLAPGVQPRPVTPEPAEPRAERFADPVLTPDGRHAVCVRERHRDGEEPENDLVAVALGGSPTAPRRLAGGHDFFASPRLSPDGSRLAWVTWDHPDMPWDASRLWVAELGAPGGEPTLGDARLVAGGPDESVSQPRWSPDGRLHYLSDRSGWWNLYEEAGTALCPCPAEFGAPDWIFGNSSYGFLADGRLAASWHEAGGDRIGFVVDGAARPIELPFTHYAWLDVGGERVVAVAASPTAAPAVVRVDPDGGAVEVLRRSRERVPGEPWISVPEPFEFPTGGGERAHGLFYAPRHPERSGLAGELPPVVVVIHGGPTSATSAVLNLAVQYWTTRGFAVADVDYRGSSGYGRAYRRALEGRWGIADVEDCAAAVAWLASGGRVDGRRAVIRGGSAGGFTTLAALAFTDAFAAGASLYGVADLELLARDTHKFESRYLDRLVGPYPAAAEEYRRRSPIHHVQGITSPLVLFQGLEDRVVPPEQSELMYRALERQGVPVAYLAFEGEQHGFRQAGTIVRVAEAELDFYGRVLGFAPAGAAGREPLPLANASALPPRS